MTANRIDRAALMRAVVALPYGGWSAITAGASMVPPRRAHLRKLLGPLGPAKPTVWAECLFADPIADIAVLGSPASALYDEAETYEQFVDAVTPMTIADAPKQGTE